MLIKTTKNYRIVNHSWFNETGVCEQTYYTVQKEKQITLLFGMIVINYWATFKEKISNLEGTYKTPLKFLNLKEAYEFIGRVRKRKNTPRQQWVETVVEVTK